MAWPMVYGSGYDSIGQQEAQRNSAAAQNFWQSIAAQRAQDQMDQQAAQQTQTGNTNVLLTLASLLSRQREAADTAATQAGWHNDVRAQAIAELAARNQQFREAAAQRAKAMDYGKLRDAISLQGQGWTPDAIKAVLGGLPPDTETALSKRADVRAAEETEGQNTAKSWADMLNALTANALKKVALNKLAPEATTIGFTPEKFAAAQAAEASFQPGTGWLHSLLASSRLPFMPSETAPAPPPAWLQYAAKLKAIQDGAVPPGTEMLPPDANRIMALWAKIPALQKAIAQTGTNPLAPFVPIPQPRQFGRPILPPTAPVDMGDGEDVGVPESAAIMPSAPRPLTRDLATQFLMQTNGDKDAARTLARDAGYSF